MKISISSILSKARYVEHHILFMLVKQSFNNTDFLNLNQCNVSLRLFLCKALPRSTKGWVQCLVEQWPKASFTALKECRILLSGRSFSGMFFHIFLYNISLEKQQHDY